MPIDYSKTSMYRLVCNDTKVTDIYVGYTTNFMNRANTHKHVCNNEKNKHYDNEKYKMIRNNGGWENWTMELIELYPCNNRMEARTREQFFYEQMNATMNMIQPVSTPLNQRIRPNKLKPRRQTIKPIITENDAILAKIRKSASERQARFKERGGKKEDEKDILINELREEIRRLKEK